MEVKLIAAAELAESKPAVAAAQLEDLIISAETSEDAVKVKESAIYQLGEVYAKQGEAAKLGALLTNLRPFFATIPKAKTAKIVRTLIDQVAKIGDSLPLQMSLCRESIEWCKAEKRSFLRQRIQSRLAAMLLESKQYTEALALLAELLTEVKRLDDKPLLVEISLVRGRRRCLGGVGVGRGGGGVGGVGLPNRQPLAPGPWSLALGP